MRHLALVLSLVACSAPEPPPPAADPRVPRVVAIGDVHGDLTATRAALRLAGAIDQSDTWIGGDLTVVQVGDQLDRGDDEPDILALLERLQGEAKAAGGKLVVLNGNHELMNVAGDLRYVTPDGFADYGGQGARVSAFAPGGDIARRLAERPLYMIVGDTVFAHGGVRPAHVDAGLASLDREARAWLRGERSDKPRALSDPDSLVWTRAYGGEAHEVDCAGARHVLERLGVARMVVAHTPQKHINSVCDGRVWRVDVGLSRHYGGPVEVLSIEGAKARVLKAEAN